ncbi:MAG: hypothetical protein CUN56_12805, partial [Phototrophicales bacterium]
MRHSLILLVALILAACGSGGDEPAPTTVSNTETSSSTQVPPNVTPVGAGITDEDLQTLLPPVASPFVPPTQTPASEGALPVPLPQTLVASETEDPEPGGEFNYIYFRQTGGVNNESIVIEIFGDGLVMYNGIEGRISPEDVANLNQVIDDLNFFGLQGTMLSAAPGRPEVYYYQVY